MVQEVLKEEMKLVAFSLNGKEYAIDVKNVVSIEKMMTITRVPHVPPYVKGVINLRGVITPILDLRIRFDMEPVEYNQNTRIIIVTWENKEVGFIVDEANDVINIQEKNIEPQPDVVGNIQQNYITGVVKVADRLLIILKLETILKEDEDRVS
ncbi:chemotaxis protein CheW [Caldibacillus thermolactis]|mgnify:CR=1 FL=1|jgi:purine-binding chemotaxis protein CheW|uniref:Chemotaxis protein CheW n=1 Tax=Pallidibacillus thermolactis TaxID=251051 RepID=A0ABT2WDT3_9BACI|nr:chemotaxis protein CheW [Pallidibacillus thermolactis]MCU9593071.1 chemotaxis protein CheW [Pallidibacillus thermolactis]MCU9600737.1 chemotaxis protein CheW [Pallidibacillus thermolactis subsp. kokeshiiformis]